MYLLGRIQKNKHIWQHQSLLCLLRCNHQAVHWGLEMLLAAPCLCMKMNKQTYKQIHMCWYPNNYLMFLIYFLIYTTHCFDLKLQAKTIIEQLYYWILAINKYVLIHWGWKTLSGMLL